MASKERKLFLRSSIMLGVLLVATVIFVSQAAAARPEEVCKARCQAVAEQFKKERGVPLPPAAFKDCMDACTRPPQIKSEADIPNFCSTQCERSLRHINPGQIKPCTDRCIEQITQKFRQSRSQGRKGPEKKQ
jgi:hypothetical protein